MHVYHTFGSRTSTWFDFRPRLRPVIVVELPSNEHPPDLLRARTNGVQACVPEEPPSRIL